MANLTEELHALTGVSPLEGMGLPGLVAVVHDDYEPPPRLEGGMGMAVAAGGVGTRSEVAILLRPSAQVFACHIFDLEVASVTAAGAIQIHGVDSITGLTDQLRANGDLALGQPPIFLQVKNNAAATTVRAEISRTEIQAALTWERIPGRFTLRQSNTTRALVIRPSNDNQSISVKFAYRALYRRKL